MPLVWPEADQIHGKCQGLEALGLPRGTMGD